MNISPKYVTFEQATKLKEIGFEIPCNHYYEYALTSKKHKDDGYEGPFGWKKGELNLQSAYFKNNHSCDTSNKNWFLCAAPEQWQVVEWFRIKYGLWITISSHSSGFYYSKIDMCSDEAWENQDLRTKKNDANRKLFEYKSPEEAYSAAIDLILTF